MYRTLILLLLAFAGTAIGADWPPLPARNGAIEIPAQEWPLKPGTRSVRVTVHYPQGELSGVGEQTGIMLSLHNWGGTGCVGTADPLTLARELDVVALCIDYLQSGDKGPEPYDFGYLQALDSLRGLWWMREGLKRQGTPFAAGRLYVTGGSGGGNVSIMANKLAPRTFACVIDLCGMAHLSDDIAFGRPGGSDLNARWVRDPRHAFHLSHDAQELRYVGHPRHLAAMKLLGHSARLIIVHGTTDTTCPVEDARSMAANMQAAGLTVDPHWVTQNDLDGEIFRSTGHSLGDRTQIVLKVAGRFLKPDSPECLVRKEPTDFDLRDEVRYETAQGTWIISYQSGYPVGRFEATSVPNYPNRVDLSYVLDERGRRRPITEKSDWELRRKHIIAALEQVMGPLPSPLARVPLNVALGDEIHENGLIRRRVTYQSDSDDRVPAWLLRPEKWEGRGPAILCLQQTTALGKDEPAGLGGDKNLHYARELAERGYVTLAPDYPSFGEHPYDFAPTHGYESGSMKAVWDNVRAVDFLETLDYVDPSRIGVIGHSLGGHSAIFTAVFEPRLKAVVSSCGFTRLGRDDVPSWSGPRYMPKIATVFENDGAKLPFDFPELIGTLAPRAFFTSSARRDEDFDVRGVEEAIEALRPVYRLYGKESSLEAVYPDSGHGFPREARDRAFAFLDRILKQVELPGDR